MNGLARNGHSLPESSRQVASPFSPLQRFLGFDPLQNVMANWDYGFEVSRTDKGYDVDVPVPGFNASNIDVTFKDGILSVTGKNERRSFSRSLSVPEDVNPERITANVTDGMLRISLERNPEAQPKRITVN